MRKSKKCHFLWVFLVWMNMFRLYNVFLNRLYIDWKRKKLYFIFVWYLFKKSIIVCTSMTISMLSGGTRKRTKKKTNLQHSTINVSSMYFFIWKNFSRYSVVAFSPSSFFRSYRGNLSNWSFQFLYYLPFWADGHPVFIAPLTV